MLTPIAYSQYIYIYIYILFIQNSQKFREFTLFLLPSQPVAIVCLIQRFGATRRLSFKFSGVCLPVAMVCYNSTSAITRRVFVFIVVYSNYYNGLISTSKMACCNRL